MMPNAALKSLLVAMLAAGCAALGTPPHRSDDVFKNIQTGMSEAQVEQMIGAPDEKMRFPGSNTHAWTYRYYDTWGYMADFSVTFDAEGRSISKFSRRYDGGDKGGR